MIILKLGFYIFAAISAWIFVLKGKKWNFMGDSIFFKLFFTFCYAKRFFFSPIWFLLVKNQSLNWVFPFLGLVWFLLTQFMLLMLNFGLLKYRAGLFFWKKQIPSRNLFSWNPLLLKKNDCISHVFIQKLWQYLFLL